MNMFGLTVHPGDPSRAKLSAEERLLQVIQSGGEAPVQGSVKRRWDGFYRTIRSALQRKKPQFKKKAAQGSRLVRLNKILGAVIVVGMILAITNVFFFKPDIGLMHTRVARALAPQGHPDFNPVSVEEVLAPIASRNIFQPKTAEEPPPAANTPPTSITPSLTGALENLQLVGIAWGAQAEAMIREKKEGRTFFLKQGEQLRGVLIKEILKDRVIVEYEGQTKELI